MTHLACIDGFNLTRFDCAIIVMENGGFTFYWLAGNCFRLSQMPDPESEITEIRTNLSVQLPPT